MKTIYSSALVVNSWINVEIDPACASLQRLLSLNDQSVAEDLGPDPDFWTPMKPLWADPYWFRIWTQQEISLATSLRICTPNAQFSAYHLFHCIRVFRLLSRQTGDYSIYWPLTGPKILLPSQFGYLDSASHSSKGSTLRIDDHNLLAVLRNNANLQCTDDRDRVYGLLSLANNIVENDFRVDYKLTIPEIFKLTSVFILNHLRALDFLVDADLNSPWVVADSMPSWVPDWARVRTRERDYGSSIVMFQFSPEIANEMLSDYGKLKITGIRIASIRQVFRLPVGVDFVKFSIAEMLVSMLVVVSTACRLQPNSHTGDFTAAQHSNWLALWRAIVRVDFKERIYGSEAGSEARRELEAAALILLQLWNSTKGNKRSWNFWAETVYTLLSSPTPRHETTVLTLHMLLSRLGGGDSLFVGSEGQIGMAPDHTQPNDEIWRAVGCSKAIILRPTESKSHYKVVGEGYLEGYNGAELASRCSEDIGPGDLMLGHPAEHIVLV